METIVLNAHKKKRNKLEIRQTSRLFCWNSLAHAKWAYVYKWFISLLLPVRAGARCTLTYLSVNSQVLFIYSRFYINQIYHHNVFVVGTHWIFSERTQWMKSCDCVGEETAKHDERDKKRFSLLLLAIRIKTFIYLHDGNLISLFIITFMTFQIDVCLSVVVNSYWLQARLSGRTKRQTKVVKFIHAFFSLLSTRTRLNQKISLGGITYFDKNKREMEMLFV